MTNQDDRSNHQIINPSEPSRGKERERKKTKKLMTDQEKRERESGRWVMITAMALTVAHKHSKHWSAAWSTSRKRIPDSHDSPAQASIKSKGNRRKEIENDGKEWKTDESKRGPRHPSFIPVQMDLSFYWFIFIIHRIFPWEPALEYFKKRSWWL